MFTVKRIKGIKVVKVNQIKWVRNLILKDKKGKRAP